MCIDWGVSIRGACGALRFDTSTFHYKFRRTDQAAVERRIREICETRVRYDYRRVHILLRWEGWTINMKKTRRVYNELGLQLRNKHPKRRVKAKLREDRQEAAGPNDVRAMDFVHDQLATGKKLRILTIVDTHSRFSPAVDPRFTYRGEDVVQTLERVCACIGHPKIIRVDNVLRREEFAVFGLGSRGIRFVGHPEDGCPGGLRRQEVVSPIANTGSA
ncbi:integrase [Defluviimonas sp. 20V17]|nr:integrase [Defluviimonas sp. 20V17]